MLYVVVRLKLDEGDVLLCMYVALESRGEGWREEA